MPQIRPLYPQELVLRVFPPGREGDAAISEHEIHVYRIGVATGTAVPACTQGQWLQNRGLGYWEYPPHGWILENAPICPTCLARLAQEGIIKK